MMLNFVKTGCQRKLTPLENNMMKMKKPVELNATIYNRLVKVFNDAANGFNRWGNYDAGLKHHRSRIIELRKQFPTYQEMKDAGVKFVDASKYLNDANEEVSCMAWEGNASEAKVIYFIDFCRGSDQPISLKIYGTPAQL